jgi:hypothetical protein
VYIWAWRAAPLAPEALISSRMTLAAVSESPGPLYSSGIKAASHPLLGQGLHELGRVPGRFEAPPVFAGKALAQGSDPSPDIL